MGMTATVRRSERFTIAEYLKLQQAEAFSEENRVNTIAVLGNPNPSKSDLWMHYATSNGAVDWAGIHSDLNLWGASQVVGQDVMDLPEKLREAVLKAVYGFWKQIFATASNQASEDSSN